MNDLIWRSVSEMRPISSKMKDHKRIILHFNPPGFYK